MPTNQDTAYRKEITKLTRYFLDAKDDPALSKQLSENPLGVLQSMNIYVGNEFQEAVASQLQEAVKIASSSAPEEEINAMPAEACQLSQEVKHILEEEQAAIARPSAPTNLRVEVGVQSAEVPADAQEALEFVVHKYGLILIVREPAIKFLQGGGEITKEVLGSIGLGAELIGLIGVILAAAGTAAAISSITAAVAIVLGIVAITLSIYLTVIAMTDQGKGVNIIWTWPQLIPVVPTFGLPWITPVI